jgi:23S rRNA (cytosine1962-C5)-methyltransferase
MRYDGVIMDPPAFGRGPSGEVWTLDRLFAELCRACRNVLSADPHFVVATVYTKGITAEDLRAAIGDMIAGLAGGVAVGELTTVERSAGRVIHNALFARWQVDMGA